MRFIVPLVLLAAVLLMNCTAQAAGTFARGITIPTQFTAAHGHPVAAVAAGDLTGTGNDDLVFVNNDATSIGVLLGNGDGSFRSILQPIFLINQPLFPTSISMAIGDFDHDGKGDLVVAAPKSSSGGGTVLRVYRGNGDGTFQAPVDYPLGFDPVSISTGDLNGDGSIDLVFGTARGAEVMFGNGDGSFRNAPSLIPDRSGFVGVGDFNHDGKADLVWATASNDPSRGEIGVALGNGDGTFQPEIDQTFPILTPVPINNAFSSVGVLDVDQDGKTDLAIIARDDWWVHILLGNGDGTFRTGEDYGNVGDNGTGQLAVGDFNHDGRPDLVIPSTDSTLSLCLNEKMTHPLIAPTFKADPIQTGDAPTVVATGDLNGDGRADLITAGGVVSKVSVRFGNGDGTFQPKVDYPTDGPPALIAVGDLNGDGKPDLAVIAASRDQNALTGTVDVLLNRGDGTFMPAAAYLVDQLPSSLVLTDVNLDGRPDIITANNGNGPTGISPGSISVLLNKGDGSFAPRRDFFAGIRPTEVAAGDFNRDGQPDLAIYHFGNSSASEPTLSIWLGAGDGTFRHWVDYPGFEGGASIVTADLEGEGKVDLVTHIFGGLGVFLGNGDGTFRSQRLLTNGEGISIAVADFNNDGPSDLAMTSFFGSGVVTGYGDGHFSWSEVPIASGTQLAVADFNNDGKPDLVVVGSTKSDIVLFLNTTPDLEATPDRSVAKAGDSIAITVNAAPAVQAPPTLAVSGPCVDAGVVHTTQIPGSPLYSGFYLAPPGSTDCTVTFAVTATRSSDGAPATGSTTVSLDRTPPATEATLSGVSVTPGNYKSLVDVRLATVDTGSGVDYIAYSVDNDSCSPDAPGRCTLDRDPFDPKNRKMTEIRVGAEGRHTVYYFGRDLAGNFEPRRSLAFRIDSSPPVARAQRASTFAETAAPIILVASDSSGESLAYSIVTSPKHGTLGAILGNHVTYTPAPGFTGDDQFAFIANDGVFDSAPATVTLVVAPVHPPVASGASVTTFRNTPVGVILSASDADGRPMTYSIVKAPSHGTISGTYPTLVYTPMPGYLGPDRLDFSVHDGLLDSNVATVVVQVAIPLLTIGSATVTPGRTAQVAISATEAVADVAGLKIALRVTPPPGSPPALLFFQPTDRTKTWLSAGDPERPGQFVIANPVGVSGPADLLLLSFSVPVSALQGAVYTIEADAALLSDDGGRDVNVEGSVQPGRVTVGPPLQKGDVDGDGTVDPADVVLVLQIAVGETAPTDDAVRQAADVDCDKRITLVDALQLLQSIVLNRPLPDCR